MKFTFFFTFKQFNVLSELERIVGNIDIASLILQAQKKRNKCLMKLENLIFGRIEDFAESTKNYCTKVFLMIATQFNHFF